MDDKRTLLAYFLISLIFIVWITFIFPTGQKKVQQGDNNKIDKEVTSDIKKNNVLLHKEPNVKEISTDTIISSGKDVIVNTDLFEAIFSTKGAVLKSFKLKKFSGKRNEVGLYLYSNENAFTYNGAFNILLRSGADWVSFSSVNFEVNKDEINVAGANQQELEFSYTTKLGTKIVKKIIIRGDSYVFDLNVRIESSKEESFSGEYAINWDGGLLGTENNDKNELSYLSALTCTKGSILKDDIRKITEKNKKGEPISHIATDVLWAGVRNKYFLSAIVPVSVAGKQVDVSGAEHKDKKWGTISYLLRLPFSNQKIEHSFIVYMGPLEYDRLNKYSKYRLQEAVDLGTWLKPISWLILKFMVISYGLIKNYGVVIILFVIVIKAILYFPSHKSMLAMKDMQKLQPEMEAIRNKYKNNPQAMNAATMELYKKHKINPFGSCLWMLPQIPIFFALYKVLYSAVELRRSSFFLWINDLSSPDVIYKLPFSLPVIGSNICVLPILMGGTMLLQQKMTPTTTTDPIQKMMMNYFMPIFMTIVFYNMPSGLVLYWFVFNLLSIAQQWYIQKKT